MTAVTLAEIYDALKHSNGEYCSICFSPSSKRKLVTPVYIIQLRISIKYPKTDDLKNKFKVCYICEAMAARAVKFQQVVTLAASVEVMLTWMTDELRDVLVHSRVYPEGTYIKPEMRRAVFQMKEVEEEMQKTPLQPLGCSHVLVVGTDTPPSVPVANLNTGTVGPSDSHSGTKLIELVNLRKPQTQWSPKEKLDIKCNKPKIAKHPPPLVQLSSGPLQLQVKEQSTGNVKLYPIIIGKNKKLYVPELKVEIVNNEFLRSVDDTELHEQANIPIPPRPPPPPTETVSIPTQQKEYSTMIENYCDFINQSVDKDKYESDPLQLSNDVDETVLNKKARLETRNTNGASALTHVKDAVKPVRTYAMKPIKKPVLQMHKVLDWEDKIPMDVISFMDATDPNPTERIMQPNAPAAPPRPPTPAMGVISDVRTINESESNGFNVNEVVFNRKVNHVIFQSNDREEVDNDVVLVENIECIDLC